MTDIFVNAQPLTPKEIVEASVRAVKTNLHEDRMKERQAILDRYTGKRVAEQIDNYFSDNTKALAIVAEHNIVKRIVNREAQVYSEMPTISFPEENTPKKDEKTLPEDYNQVERWMIFKKSERRTRLLGTGAIHPFWRDGTLNWEYISDFKVWTGIDPLEPEVITYPLAQHSTHRVDEGKDTRLFAYWSKEKHFLFNGDGTILAPTEKNPNHENPYGILPFVFVHPDFQDGEFWVESPQLDTVNVMDAVNKGVTEGRLGIRFAMGQRVLSGDMDDNFIELGIDMLLKTPEDTSYSHEAPNSDFAGIIDMIKFDLQIALANHGQAAEFAEQGTTSPSGFSLVIRNMPLLEGRKSDLGFWRWYDKDCYEIEQTIWDVENGEGDLADGRHVDYAEPKFPKTVAERIESENHDLELGLTNLAALLQRRDPDGYPQPEDAVEQITANKEINKALGFRGANEPAPTPSILLATGEQSS